MFAFDGGTPPPGLVRRIAHGEAAGVVLFARNIYGEAELKRLTSALQSLPRPRWARAPLLVMVDQEGGAISRLPWLELPSASAIGARDDSTFAYEAGRSAGAGLRGGGVNVNLAPVADVATSSSAIGEQGRAFGGEPESVSRLATAFASGLANAGVAPTAKHFPGFGSAESNTDHGPVTIHRNRAALQRLDLAPFRSLIDGGVPIVMVSTATYPALAGRQAALSHAVVTDLLREQLGFTGVAITDDLETPATAVAGTPELLAESAARAGNDLLIFAKTFEAGDLALRGIESALRAGRLPRVQAERSAERVLMLRRDLDGGGVSRILWPAVPGRP